MGNFKNQFVQYCFVIDILKVLQIAKANRLMVTPLKLYHLCLPLYLSVVYIYFILLLNRYLYISIILVSIFFILLFIYALRTYALLHFKAKTTKNLKQLSNINSEKIFECKKVDQNLRQLRSLIKSQKRHQSVDFRKQYLDYYQQTSYCNYCQCPKPPRAYHCTQCKTCVLRREKHSQLIGQCVGEGNIKPFIQYMFVGMVVSCYMTVSLIVVTVGQYHQLNQLSTVELLMFALEEMVLLACLLLFVKEFSISYYNAKSNITETQRKQNIIDVKNNPFNEKDFYHQLFSSGLDYFSINNIADYSQWMDMTENR